MNCAIQDSMCEFFTPLNLILLGIFFFLVIVVVLLRKRQPESIVAYKTDNGNVTISRSAIVELVRTSCQQINQVNKPKLKVFVKRGLTHFDIKIQLTSGGCLKDVEETLQQHLRESLSKNLGIESLGNINVIVTSFKSGKIRPSSSSPVLYTSTAQEGDNPQNDSLNPTEDSKPEN